MTPSSCHLRFCVYASSRYSAGRAAACAVLCRLYCVRGVPLLPSYLAQFYRAVFLVRPFLLCFPHSFFLRLRHIHTHLYAHAHIRCSLSPFSLAVRVSQSYRYADVYPSPTPIGSA